MKKIILSLALFLLAAPAFGQRTVTHGATDQSVELLIIDETTGVPETGVLFNTAGIDLWYRRPGAVKTSITEATLAALTTAHTDGGFLEIGNGVYRLDLPDAAFASGVSHVTIGGTVTGMIVRPVTVQLAAFDLQTPLQSRILYVQADTGSDSNDGKSWATAKLTIAAAISAASAGDTIMVGLGTYVENVVINKHGITLAGVSREECIIQPASGTAAGTSKENVTVRNLTMTSNAAAADVGFTCLSHDGLVIDNCNMYGSFDGLQTGGSHNVRILNCYVEGKYDGANFGQCRNLWVENSTFASTANYAGADTAFRGAVAIGSSSDPAAEVANGRFVNCNFIVNRTTAGTERVSALELEGAWTLIGCKLAAKSTSGTHTGGVYGLREAASLPHQVSCVGCLFSTSGAAGTVQDINNAQSTSRVELIASTYDSSKYSGNVADALKPVVAGRKVDITATGAAGIDWANVENPTTTLNLSGTTTNLTLADINSAIVTESGLATQELNILLEMIESQTDDIGVAGAGLTAVVGTGDGSLVAADVVGDSYTWFGQRYRATNIVEVESGYVGPLALKPDMNPGVSILTVDSVTIIGPEVDEEPVEVEADDLTVDRSRTRAIWTVPALTVEGTYDVRVKVTTVENQQITTVGTMKVY
jgi:hypothetical protein